MARFYKAVAMKEEQTKQKDEQHPKHESNDRIDIPNKPDINLHEITNLKSTRQTATATNFRTPEIFIKTDSIENKQYKFTPQQSQDSETSENKWQQMSYDEDYTASTVSTDEDFSDEDSLNEEIDRGQYVLDEETYNPRNKITRPSPVEESPEEEREVETEQEIEEEQESEEEEKAKLSPLPDPNFVPKPILKRRETQNNFNDIKPNITENGAKQVNHKKDDKIPLLKRITKIPVQKTFAFPKILNKKEADKTHVQKSEKIEGKKENSVEKENDKIIEESKTVIDYYGNIVKEYGSHKKSPTPLYLNTDDLKTVAEKQQVADNEGIVLNNIKTQNNTDMKDKPAIKKIQENLLENKVGSAKVKGKKTVNKPQKINEQIDTTQSTLLKKEKKIVTKGQTKAINASPMKSVQDTQVLLRKTERATIIIPIDYQKLEARAKRNVRSAIDYTVDVCLLLLAFWVYFFRDERLAIPILILIIYRQLQETILLNIPTWIKMKTPDWLKKKTS